MKSINFLMKQNRYCKFLALPLLLLTLCANYAKGTDVTWTQVAWGDITTSDVFIITITNSGTTYLMTSANGTSSTPGLGNTGTLSASDTKCTFSENDNVKWKKDASSRLCMATNTSKWIYTGTKNNALRVGTSTSGNIWSLDGDYIKSNEGRYLSIYSTTDFRSYTSKQPGQVTRFYKASSCSNKVDLTKGSPSNGSFTLTHFFLTLEAYWTNLGLISEAYRIILYPIIYIVYYPVILKSQGFNYIYIVYFSMSKIN